MASHGRSGDAGRAMAVPRFARNLAWVAVLTAAYFIAGKLGLRLAFAHPSATPVWPRRDYRQSLVDAAMKHALPAWYLADLEATQTVD